ncbi:MAG: formate dehydrogenase-N subunit alpha [Deltaproteobacteria bacterium]|nr:MAG: formate dehydrogenase-N subunit alpha [Deltaproteobacteria bacterium]
MTNPWIDIKNSDCILIMGSNAAENHPVSFKWVTEAMKRGAKLINVDPRFTRTSSKADFYAPLRSGTDIAFLGGMIKYILENEKYFKEYVSQYTNACFILTDKFGFKDGLFSGFDAATRKYDKGAWAFERDAKGNPKKDHSLQDPRCVFQQLKKHYSRYDVDTVSKITGTAKEDLLKVYEMYSATGRKGKAGTIMYAMGWTQHTVGVQNIRAMAIIQLLLGNMGVAGGGVNALRGESNVQGSTDHCILFHILPGYLKTPKASQTSLAAYNGKYTPKAHDPLSANWWGNYPKYSVSLLKSFFGDKATRANDFGYGWLPRLDDGKTYSWLDIFDKMYRGGFSGFFAWGQNPAASGANSNKTRQALAKLDWMVNVNIFDNETGSFWKGPGMDPRKIKTEVFFLPCAVSVEKEGSITNSGRWMQWRYKAADPPGDARPDGDILVELFKKVRWFYKKDIRKGKQAVFPDPILNLKWDYTTRGRYDPHKVAKEINGYFLKDVTFPKKNKSFKKGDLVPSFAYLRDDGSTSSGNWLYCNSYTNKGNMAARRKREKSGIGLNLEWSWCWPVNRRIIYNRASVDPYGNPWDKEHPVIRWNPKAKGGKGGWIGDVPDGGWPPMLKADGTPNPKTKYPFIMKPEGFARIFGPGRADGPFPEHYEPIECPVERNLLSGQLINPVAPTYATDRDVYRSCDPRYPFVGTTYRVSEHWQSGVMTRWQPWLLETQPQLFVEMSPELAGMRGIKNGEKVIVESARGQVIAVAIVTHRFRPFNIQGSVIHEVGLPWHFGWVYPRDSGDSANLLTASTGDPNTRIPESKAFMVNVRKA